MLLASLLFSRPPTVSFIFSFFNRRFRLFYLLFFMSVIFLTFLHSHQIVNLWIRFCFCRELQIKTSMQSILDFVWSISNPFLTPSWGTGVRSQKRHICHFKVSSDKQKIQKILSAFFFKDPKSFLEKTANPGGLPLNTITHLSADNLDNQSKIWSVLLIHVFCR